MNSLAECNLPRIVLASSSPQRKYLLKKIVDDYEILPSQFDESTITNWPPEKHVMELAYGKARAVASKIDEGLIIGADTVVVLDDRILGKPSDDKEAQEMLSMLSGRTHSVLTGICVLLVKNGRIVREMLDFEKTLVTFQRLDKSDIESYVETGEPRERAGAYAIQAEGSRLVEHIEGDYDNVVGLPVARLAEMLEKINNDGY